MDVNNVVLTGRLADHVRYYPEKGGVSSRAVGRLIVNRPPSSNGGSNYDTFQIVAWGKKADAMAKWTHKGKELSVVGSLRTNNKPRANGTGWDNYTEILVREQSFGRDSNQRKLQLAVKGKGDSASALLAGNLPGSSKAFAQLLKENPELREKLEQAAAKGKKVAG